MKSITQFKLNFKSGLLFLLALFLCLGCWKNNNAWAKDYVVLLSSEGENFKQTIKGLKDDLAEDVKFIEYSISDKANSKSIEKIIHDSHPKLLVFLGNKPLQAYSQYQQKYTGSTFPPSIALSALYLDRQLRDLKNTNGIRYEIPAVTSLVQLRSIVKHPIRKVGVIYREWMSDFIKQNQAYCEKERIELVAVKIPNKASIGQLSYHLKHLLHENIDALWVVNDNGLLQPRYIQNAWIPLLKNFNKPVLVGIKALAESNLNFGTFSVEADHYALGVQGAEMISDIMDNDWQISEPKIDPPLSISNLLNIKLSKKKNILLDNKKMGQIDKLIQ
ncbi:MAG: hypothetical protein OQL19_07005 [Gammaproteobacteria bacterium]|nr:hypothetical protein [Gammaproteobacteria bacterium]